MSYTCILIKESSSHSSAYLAVLYVPLDPSQAHQLPKSVQFFLLPHMPKITIFKYQDNK